MGDQGADIEFSAEYEAGNLCLEGEIGGIAAEEVFFVGADGREVEGGRGKGRKGRKGRRGRWRRIGEAARQRRPAGREGEEAERRDASATLAMGVGEEEDFAGTAH